MLKLFCWTKRSIHICLPQILFFNNISKPNGKIPLLFVEGLKLNSRLAYEMSNSTLCRLEKGLKERTHRKLMFSKGAGKLCSGCAFQQKWLVGSRLEWDCISWTNSSSVLSWTSQLLCLCAFPPRHSHTNSIIFHSFTIFRASLLLTAPPPS